jgi:hypothetical protein
MEYVATAHQNELDRRWKMTAMLLALFALTPILLVVIGRFLIKESFDGDLARYYQITRLLYGGTIIIGLSVIALRRLGTIWVRRAAVSASSKLAKLQTLTIIAAALGELIGILGFVAFLITGDFQFCWRLGVVSLVIILWCFPRRAEWARAISGR